MSTTRRTLLLVGAVAVAACSSKKGAPLPAEPCLPGEISSSAPGIASVDGVTAHACWGERCLTLDRDGKATGPADRATTEVAQRAAAAAVRTSVSLQDPAKLVACNDDGKGTCIEMPSPAGMATGHYPTAASPSLKRLTVFFADRVEAWDPKAKSVVATFPMAFEALRAEHVGDTHVMVTGAGGGPWTLMDLVAGTSATVGEPGWDLRVIDATTAVVFKDDKLVAINVAKMAPTSTFILPGRVAMATGWFDRVFVVLDHPAGTAQIDPATGTIYTAPALPICK